MEGETSGSGGRRRRFSSAVQPEIMRVAEKDDHYAAYVHDACRDAVRHLLGQQTLGEEYCLISQKESALGSSRMTARGILLAESQSGEAYEGSNLGRNQGEPLDTATTSSSSAPSLSTMSRIRRKFHNALLWTVQRWPLMLPLAREVIQLALRTNLMFFSLKACIIIYQSVQRVYSISSLESQYIKGLATKF